MSPSPSQLPAGWTYMHPGELACDVPYALSIGPFGSNLKVSDYMEEGVPLVFVRNIRAKSFSIDLRSKFVTQAKAAELSAHHVEPGDVLVTKMGDPPGDACVYPCSAPRAVITADCVRFAVDPRKASPAFVALLFETDGVKQQVLERTKGVAQRKISLATFRSLLLPVPPREEQDRILQRLESLLGEVGNGVEGFRRALTGLSQYRDACLAAAFAGTACRLAEVALIQSGITKGRPRGDDLIEMSYIRTANVQALRLDLEVIKTLPVTAQQRERHLLQEDDVLVLEGGDADKVGRGWIWSGEVADCLHQNHVFVVRPDPKLMLPRFLAYYLNAPSARTYFLSVAKQSVNLASINQSDLKNLPVPLPPLEEQRASVAMLDRQLSATAEMEAGLRTRLGDAAVLRRSILRAGVEGRLASHGSPGGLTDETAPQASEELARCVANGRVARREPRAVPVGE